MWPRTGGGLHTVMKKTISVLAWILAAVLFAASVTACGGQMPEEKTEERTTENTEAPKSEAPTTKVPETEAPTTEAPATEAPTTEEPTTEEQVNAVVPDGMKEYPFGGVVFCIPEDFKELYGDSSSKALVSENYPSVGDNMSLTFTKGTRPRKFYETYSEENLKKTLNDSFQRTYKVELENYTYQADHINGLDRAIARYTVHVQGIEMQQICCVIDLGMDTITESFTIMSDAYTELFEAAVNAMWPEK